MKKHFFYGPLSRLGLGIALAAFLLDQLSKTFVLYGLNLTEGEHITITPFFDLILNWNSGISYGLLTQASMIGQYILAGFEIIVALAITHWLARINDRLVAWGLGLIIGGALGNALDRILYGAVADFFSLHFRGFYWYIFNVADVAIVAGVALLLFDGFVPQRRRK